MNEKDQEPEIEPFSFYLDCFFELNTCRNGITNTPIPFTSIREFATIYDIEDFEEFLYIIRRLDEVYMDHQDKKEKSSRGKSNKSH